MVLPARAGVGITWRTCEHNCWARPRGSEEVWAGFPSDAADGGPGPHSETLCLRRST